MEIQKTRFSAAFKLSKITINYLFIIREIKIRISKIGRTAFRILGHFSLKALSLFFLKQNIKKDPFTSLVCGKKFVRGFVLWLYTTGLRGCVGRDVFAKAVCD